MNAELKLEWAQRLINVVCGEPWGDGNVVMDVGMGYAEPGYHDNVTTWVTGSWWVRDKETGELEMHPITKAFDRLGIEWEWHDEWEKCSHCNKLFRTSGDSYMWKMFGVLLDDGGWLCGECVVDPGFLPDALEPFINNPNNRVAFCDASHLEALGWVRYNERPYQSEWHEGMNADPQKVYDEIRASHLSDYDVLFYKDEASQFYSEWSVFTKTPIKDDEGDEWTGPYYRETDDDNS